MLENQNIDSENSVFSRVINWLGDVRNLLLVVSVMTGLIFIYQINQEESRVEAISNAANEYAPLMSECLDQSSTLECLGKLKLIADKATFEATQKVALEQS
ncbi:hypothetical protein [Vibrio vulnificus]|uniref:Uncharacterized protein n=1 Tax=Vibrio vulnificus TaxID=672 RepID=A0A2S3R254_VIBVL|nr:hypothetical protein [Vibrio vulnificus]POB47184.1 hypothetical protein CRN52_13980 [Vibrio vulnificus]